MMSVAAKFPQTRMRRLRQHKFIRDLVQETQLGSHDLIYPMFIVAGINQKQKIEAMPGIERFSLDLLLVELEDVVALGIPAIALFPVIEPSQKSLLAEEAYNPNGLIQKAVIAIKSAFPNLGVITDVALDPYTQHGHDGILNDKNSVDNDATLGCLVKQALSHAQAGADIIAPSDMMDGRVGAIRQALEEQHYPDAIILAYSAKYASAYYAPFREAIASTKAIGINKDTYQMNPANLQEAYHEAVLDINEGADMIMVKPALSYLDVIQVLSQLNKPLFAYQVSGEYAMHMAAFQNGWLDKDHIILESLLAIKRAGADAIMSYFAKDAAKLLK